MTRRHASLRALFEGFMGKTADQNVAEYKKRSPYALASKLETPLLIHSTRGHYFNRIDTPLARESRRDILTFLARYLK